MFKLTLSAVCLVTLWLAASNGQLDVEDPEITGYHFHTYFHQGDPINKQEAIDFRTRLNEEILAGKLTDCYLGRFHQRPIGPHPIGMFQVCCNKTGLRYATSWFMKNVNTNLSVLLHPLTTEERKDHLERGMWMGRSMPLVSNGLQNHLDDVEICPAYNPVIGRTV